MSSELSARPREALGTRAAKRLRLEGRVPASIQGEGKPNRDVSLDEQELLAARRAHEHLFDVRVDGEPELETVLVRELQWDTTTERILHVEFRRVVRGRKTEVEVELTFEGRVSGGVLNHLATHLTVLALPKDIPDSVVVDVEGLEPGHTLHARDLTLPEGIELADDPDLAIVNVTVPRGIEEEAEAPEAPVEPESVPTVGETEAGEAGEQEES